MAYKRLFILIEGDDDERFFEKIMKPKFEKNNYTVQLWKYAHKNNRKIKNFLKSINSMGAEYIHVNDINNFPCVIAKKAKIKEKFRNFIDNNRVTVVIKEIESWYLAGLSNADSKNLNLKSLKNTDDITKEKFNQLIPTKFTSRIDFMTEILKYFSCKTAKEKNKSFKYFFEKFCISI